MHFNLRLGKALAFLICLHLPMAVYSENQIKIGDVVCLLERNSRGRWPLAIVEEVLPGPDGKIRTVKIRICVDHKDEKISRNAKYREKYKHMLPNTTLYTRHVCKLMKLYPEDDEIKNYFMKLYPF